METTKTKGTRAQWRLGGLLLRNRGAGPRDVREGVRGWYLQSQSVNRDCAGQLLEDQSDKWFQGLSTISDEWRGGASYNTTAKLAESAIEGALVVRLQNQGDIYWRSIFKVFFKFFYDYDNVAESFLFCFLYFSLIFSLFLHPTQSVHFVLDILGLYGNQDFPLSPIFLFLVAGQGGSSEQTTSSSFSYLPRAPKPGSASCLLTQRLVSTCLSFLLKPPSQRINLSKAWSGGSTES